MSDDLNANDMKSEAMIDDSEAERIIKEHNKHFLRIELFYENAEDDWFSNQRKLISFSSHIM